MTDLKALPSLQSRIKFSKVLKLTWMVSAVLLVVVGLSLWFSWAPIVTRWPWALTPFNTNFLGAIYFSMAIPLIGVLCKPKRQTILFLLPLFTLVTAYIFLLSCIYFGEFLPRKSTWIWFILYGIDSLIGLFFCSRHLRSLLPLFKPSKRYIYWPQIFILVIVSLSLLLPISNVLQSWLWPLDQFHSRLYSGIFLTGAVSSYLVLGKVNSWSRILLAITQSAVGTLMVLGLYLTNQRMHKLNWGSFSLWIWLSFFLIFAGLGIISVLSETRIIQISD